MRHLTALLLTLLAATADAQSYRLSDKRADGTPLFPYRWETVPAPKLALRHVSTDPGITYHEWTTSAAGTYEVRNALVDHDQKIGAWSQPKTLTLGDGWTLRGSPANLPMDARAAAVAWNVKRLPDGPDRLYVWDQDVGGPHAFQSLLPNAPLSLPQRHQLVRGIDWLARRPGGSHTAVAPPPDVIATGVPNVPLRAAYAFVAHNGDTALSPPVDLPAAPGVAATVGAVRRLAFDNQAFPVGALGYHLYVQRVGGPWHRQPARKCGAPTADDYLWQPDNNAPQLLTFREDTPGQPQNLAVGPNGSAEAQSYLDPLSLALKYTWADVIVDVPVTAYVPLVDEYEGLVGPALDPAGPVFSANPFGTPAQKFNPNRTISAGTAKVTAGGTAPGCAHATYFPALLVQGRSNWSGVTLDSASAATRNRSAGVAFRDYSGGQCFGCKFTGCSFTCRTDAPAWPTQGLRVLQECAGVNGHTASELVFHECLFQGCVCIWLENAQTANVQFTGRTYAVNNCTDCRCPALWLNMPTPVTFEALYAQSGGTVISLGWSPTLTVGKLFVDGACTSLIDANGQQPGTVLIGNLGGGKVNLFARGDVPPCLYRVANSTAAFPLKVAGTTIQCDLPGVRAVHMAPMRAALRCDDTNLLTVLTAVEPSHGQFAALHAGVGWWQTPPDEPGYSVPVPSRPTRDLGGVVNGSVDPVTIVLNSLTGPVQKLTRLPWSN